MERVEILKRLKGYQKMLYNIDMVNGFVREGVLHDEYIGHTIDEQIKLIEKFKNEDQGIAFTKDCHTKDSIEFETFPEHCLIGTPEAELVDELKPYEKDAIVYPKNSTSTIFALNIMSDIKSMENLIQVVGTGCCADICVLNFLIPLKNYFNELNKKVAIFVVKDATETYHIEGVHDRDYFNKIAYELMAQAGIIVVKNIQELEEKEEELGLVLQKTKGGNNHER